VTVRPLRLIGDPVLRSPCRRVTTFNAGLLYIDRLTGERRRDALRQLRQQAALSR
jgi:hypothetical protein